MPVIRCREFDRYEFESKTLVAPISHIDAGHLVFSIGRNWGLKRDLAQIVDGLHSLDPTAGMDIGAIKSQYGEKLILFGNVSVDALCRKSADEVIQETKNCLRQAAPGGGYILSSSNSWFTDAKLENCLAMVETARKYGRYPISVP